MSIKDTVTLPPGWSSLMIHCPTYRYSSEVQIGLAPDGGVVWAFENLRLALTAEQYRTLRAATDTLLAGVPA